MIIIRFFILWVPFLVGTIAALIAALGFVFDPEDGYFRNNIYALDRAAAAALGCSGKFTCSAEAYARSGSHRGWVMLRWVLDRIEKDHCKKAADKEGL